MSEEPDSREGGTSDWDDPLQREIDEALGGKSLEELLGESAPAARARAPSGREITAGEIYPCRVVAVDRDAVLMEMGGKDQGYVPLAQFEKVPQAGDVLQLEVVRYDDSEDLWVLSREGAVERATWDDLSEGTIVEAFVEKANKGGLEVRFNAIPAFMPVSHISLYRVEDPAEYVGQKIRCQVIEMDRRERRVIVSARALLELEVQEQREALWAELAEGDIREGIVRQVMAYGAFVDLGGLDGLVHVSQMSYGRVENPSDLVEPGQTVQVKVLKLDRDANRVSLGMKQVHPDPWDTVEVKYRRGVLVTGRVVNLENFGAFVELEPGVEALIPIGEMSWTQRVRHPSEILQTGQSVDTLITQVDLERKRITLSLKEVQANPWTGAAQKYPAQSEQAGRVSRIVDFGAFVELEPGVEGLIHISELAEQHVRRVEDVVQTDQPLRVRVLEVDEQRRRISLSAKGVLQDGQVPEDLPAARPKKKRKKPLRGGLD